MYETTGRKTARGAPDGRAGRESGRRIGGGIDWGDDRDDYLDPDGGRDGRRDAGCGRDDYDDRDDYLGRDDDYDGRDDYDDRDDYLDRDDGHDGHDGRDGRGGRARGLSRGDGYMGRALAASGGRGAARRAAERAAAETESAADRFARASGAGLDPEDETDDEEAAAPLTQEELEELSRLEEMASAEEAARSEKRRRAKKTAATIALSVACAYLVALIYGTFVTQFRYDEKGKVEPVVMSVADIAEKNEFSLVYGFYLRARQEYENILTLDYRIASGAEDPLAVAPEYEQEVSRLDMLMKALDAEQPPAKYNQVMTMLKEWVGTHAAAYCQFVSRAFSQDDQEAEQEAIAAREYARIHFGQITKNFATLGSDVNGFDMKDLTSWSPEGFVRTEIEGLDG